MTQGKDSTENEAYDTRVGQPHDRIKECYQYNQLVHEISSLKNIIAKSKTKIGQFVPQQISINDATVAEAKYQEMIVAENERLDMSTACLNQYLVAVPRGFLPVNNFTQEACKQCKSTYIRGNKETFTCTPYAMPRFGENIATIMVLKSGINDDVQSITDTVQSKMNNESDGSVIASANSNVSGSNNRRYWK